jgi:NAD-dependent dihydropyrimidine dehydrogenase PreA subunit
MINVTFTDHVNHVGVEQKACTLCGDCVSGCNYAAKNTVLMNYSEVFDFDDPPFFKQFLRIDANNKEITVSCFGVTGCAGTEHAPSVEDQFTIVL